LTIGSNKNNINKNGHEKIVLIPQQIICPEKKRKKTKKPKKEKRKNLIRGKKFPTSSLKHFLHVRGNVLDPTI